MPVLVLTESELRACVGFDAQSLRTTEDAFTWLSEGKVEMPPVMHIEVAEHRGDVDIKSACVRGLDYLAVKVASGFFDNPKLGLPSGGAMVVVLNAKTGFCEAVMLDNAYLTDLRTGLAGAVAARYLAPETVRTVGVLGSGAQARYQVRALRLVRDFERVLVSAREVIRPGVSELPVQGEVLRAPTEAGGKMPAMMIPVLSGAKTNACHAVATRRRIHTGALVVLEVAGVHKRFHVNAARAFSLGEPSPEVQRQMPYLSPTDTTPVEGSSSGSFSY